MTDAQRPIECRSFFDCEGLALTIDLILEGDEHAPLLLAELFTGFIHAIDSGVVGIGQTKQALNESIELIYLHSPEHQAALQLFRLQLEGQLKVEDEPVELINAAIERSTRLRKPKTRAIKKT